MSTLADRWRDLSGTRRAQILVGSVVVVYLIWALATGNRDAVYEALAELPPEMADALYVQLQEQGLL